MNYQILKLLTIILPTLIIGGFEYIRHHFLLKYLSMEVGNYYITILTFILSTLFATWMFRLIEDMNTRITAEQSRRAVYEERERLARELHDNIAQTLFLLNVKLKQGKLGEAKSAVNQIDYQLRQAIFNLRSVPEDGILFSSRINKWIYEWSMLTGIEVNEVNQEIDSILRKGDEVQLFGVVQESFTNIRKHANASVVHIDFKSLGKGWRLTIMDNGKGIHENLRVDNRYGLKMMRERAAQIGATVNLSNQGRGGACLTVESVGGESI